MIIFVVIFNLAFFCNTSNANETINQEAMQALHLYVEEIADKVNASYDNNDFATVNFGEDEFIQIGDRWANVRYKNLHIDVGDVTENDIGEYCVTIDFYHDITMYAQTAGAHIISNPSSYMKKESADNASVEAGTFRQRISYDYVYRENKWNIVSGRAFYKIGARPMTHVKEIDYTPLQMLILEPYWEKYN